MCLYQKNYGVPKDLSNTTPKTKICQRDSSHQQETDSNLEGHFGHINRMNQSSVRTLCLPLAVKLFISSPIVPVLRNFEEIDRQMGSPLLLKKKVSSFAQNSLQDSKSNFAQDIPLPLEPKGLICNQGIEGDTLEPEGDGVNSKFMKHPLQKLAVQEREQDSTQYFDAKKQHIQHQKEKTKRWIASHLLNLKHHLITKLQNCTSQMGSLDACSLEIRSLKALLACITASAYFLPQLGKSKRSTKDAQGKRQLGRNSFSRNDTNLHVSTGTSVATLSLLLDVQGAHPPQQSKKRPYDSEFDDKFSEIDPEPTSLRLKFKRPRQMIDSFLLSVTLQPPSLCSCGGAGFTSKDAAMILKKEDNGPEIHLSNFDLFDKNSSLKDEHSQQNQQISPKLPLDLSFSMPLLHCVSFFDSLSSSHDSEVTANGNYRDFFDSEDFGSVKENYSRNFHDEIDDSTKKQKFDLNKTQGNDTNDAMAKFLDLLWDELWKFAFQRLFSLFQEMHQQASTIFYVIATQTMAKLIQKQSQLHPSSEKPIQFPLHDAQVTQLLGNILPEIVQFSKEKETASMNPACLFQLPIFYALAQIEILTVKIFRDGSFRYPYIISSELISQLQHLISRISVEN